MTCQIHEDHKGEHTICTVDEANDKILYELKIIGEYHNVSISGYIHGFIQDVVTIPTDVVQLLQVSVSGITPTHQSS